MAGWLRLRNVSTLRVIRARPRGEVAKWLIRCVQGILDFYLLIWHPSPMCVAALLAGLGCLVVCGLYSITPVPPPIGFLLLRARL